VNIACPIPRPVIILSAYSLSAYSLCIGVSGQSGRDRSMILQRNGGRVDFFRTSLTL
jgi:hypothetical protein